MSYAKNKKDTALQRANIYSFFSYIYREEPSKEFIEEIKSSSLKPLLNDLGIEIDKVFDSPSIIEDISHEFIRLFVGTGPKHVPPYESVYTDVRTIGDKKVGGLMWGPSTVAVREFYNEMGYEPSKEFKDMPDHISVELDFMHRLCKEEANLTGEKDAKKAKRLTESQIRFLEAHLMHWIDSFVEEVKNFTNLSFYSSSSRSLSEFLNLDLKALKE